VARYVVEVYAPNLAEGGLAELASRAQAASRELTRAGTEVRYLRTVLVPEDETCFHHFEGSSADAVRRASERAGLLAADARASVKRCLEEE
jgi:hypothetical protein